MNINWTIERNQCLCTFYVYTILASLFSVRVITLSSDTDLFPICSPLALAQAYLTRDLLKKNFSELAIDGALEICIIKVNHKGVFEHWNSLVPQKHGAKTAKVRSDSPFPSFTNRRLVTKFSINLSQTLAARVSLLASSTLPSLMAVLTSPSILWKMFPLIFPTEPFCPACFPERM